MTPYRITFGLLVTGKLEEGGRDGGRAQSSLAELFRPIRETGLCDIRVVMHHNQWLPEKLAQQEIRVGHKLTVLRAREKKGLPTWKQDLALKVRGWLQQTPGRYLLFIDDCESDRRTRISEVFADYRSTITGLLNEASRKRAAVHFLVNMVEAYFFADPESAGKSLGWPVPKTTGDPEDIPNPYGELVQAAKKLGKSYGRKRETGERVLAKIRLEEILKNPEHCAWLRAAVRWIVHSLENATDQPEALAAFDFRQVFQLDDGKIASLTGAQEVLPRSAPLSIP